MMRAAGAARDDAKEEAIFDIAAILADAAYCHGLALMLIFARRRHGISASMSLYIS